MTAEYRHVPVMLAEVLAELDPQPGEVVCDCTLGGAGHSVELARRVAPDGLSLGIDQDDMALAAATERLPQRTARAFPAQQRAFRHAHPPGNGAVVLAVARPKLRELQPLLALPELPLPHRLFFFPSFFCFPALA